MSKERFKRVVVTEEKEVPKAPLDRMVGWDTPQSPYSKIDSLVDNGWKVVSSGELIKDGKWTIWVHLVKPKKEPRPRFGRRLFSAIQRKWKTLFAWFAKSAETKECEAAKSE